MDTNGSPRIKVWNEKATAIVDTMPKEARGVRRPRIHARPPANSETAAMRLEDARSESVWTHPAEWVLNLSPTVHREGKAGHKANQ